MAEQLALDLWAPVRQEFDDRHQIGHYRSPWDWAAGPAPGIPAPKAGDLIPAWRCCHCGAIEMTRYALESEHDCCRTWTKPSCYYVPRDPTSPYRMDARWIPPAGWAAA